MGNPATLRAKFQHAVGLHQQGRLAEAERLYDEILRAQPNSFSALYMLGLAAFQSGAPQRGVELTARAIAINPNVAEAHNNLGNGLVELKRAEDALASFERAIALKPDYVEAHNNRGAALNQLLRHAEALESCDTALALRPGDAQAYYNRGLALKALKRDAEALASFDKAIALHPDYAEAYNNRAAVLNDLRRHEEALASCERAIALRPDYAEAYNNRAASLYDLQRNDEALTSYDKAIALKPDDADTHLNRSFVLLCLGRFAEGWREFEWRKKLPEALGARSFPRPLWLGETDIAGKTLLVHYEQGIGDTIHFSRYARYLEARGFHIVFLVQPSLSDLLAQLSPTIRVIGEGELPPAFDYHCPLLSLPFACSTVSETIPSPEPYLTADAQRRAAWQARLGPKTKPRIGIAWSGNPAQANDRNRSMALQTLVPLLTPDADWFALQNDVRDGDRATLQQHPEIAFFGAELRDFGDTAALLELMDLVITVDTAVAHLAGAMGKPVWIMLAYNADWRWLRGRNDSPWYPTARLFRQIDPDWTSVIAAVNSELHALLDPR